MQNNGMSAKRRRTVASSNRTTVRDYLRDRTHRAGQDTEIVLFEGTRRGTKPRFWIGLFSDLEVYAGDRTGDVQELEVQSDEMLLKPVEMRNGKASRLRALREREAIRSRLDLYATQLFPRQTTLAAIERAERLVWRDGGDELDEIPGAF